MKINEVAKLAGVSVRTLHHYDKIGLLHPAHVSESMYRIYDERDLSKLQQIMFFKELGFALEEIKNILENPNFDEVEALKNQKALLTQKRDRINSLILLAERAIKGEKEMSFKEFDTSEIETAKKMYSAEAKERWGNSKAYVESEKKTAKYGEHEWHKVSTGWNEIFEAFAANMDEKPSAAAVQLLVKKLQDFISGNFYHCTTEILKGLGQMYVADERFTKNIDKTKTGLAQFISDAIEVYCK